MDSEPGSVRVSAFFIEDGAHEAGFDVPMAVLVSIIAADPLTPRVPAVAEVHPTRSLCAHFNEARRGKLPDVAQPTRGEAPALHINPDEVCTLQSRCLSCGAVDGRAVFFRMTARFPLRRRI